MIKDLKPRTYQETIFNTATKANTLVVLPTGLGKTLISLMLAAFRLKNYPKSKVLILAPTKPLAEQHLKTFHKNFDLPENEVVLFTGYIKPDIRAEIWKTAKVIISTPQGMENDIISNRTPLQDVSLLVIDEAHRAVGDYSYVYIAKQYQKYAKYTRILGLTASPGSELEQIEEVCANLFVEEIEIKTEDDPDVKPYLQEVDINWVEIYFPDNLKKIKEDFEFCYRKKLQEIKNNGHLQGSILSYTKKSLLGLQAALRIKISEGEKDYSILKSISLLAEVMKVQHTLELLESQGLDSATKYLQKLESDAKTTTVKAVKNLLSDPDFNKPKRAVYDLHEQGVEHPKLEALREQVLETIKDNKDAKIIIFTQYRYSVNKIKKVFDELKVTSKTFIGQASSAQKGLTQKEQKEIIEKFSNGDFNCLISTSVGEEGLDIPQVDLVIFFEPIPSAVRSIQRRGRTGRLEKGKVVILMTKNTRDEAYRWTSFHKEKKMHRNLVRLKEKYSSVNKPDNSMKKISDFVVEQPLTIVSDHREKGSGIIKILSEMGVTIDLRSLEIGDYLLSENVVVEYKTKKDFVDSIIDGRLLTQLNNLTKYLKPLIIIEGEEDIYGQRNIHPNAIRGMLGTIAISYRIPILYTKNANDTASLLVAIAKREQENQKSEFQFHTTKPTSLKEQQEYIVASLPNIGATLAKPLLKKFGSVKKVLNASEENLKQIELIGDKKAKKIREVIDSDYT